MNFHNLRPSSIKSNKPRLLHLNMAVRSNDQPARAQLRPPASESSVLADAADDKPSDDPKPKTRHATKKDTEKNKNKNKDKEKKKGKVNGKSKGKPKGVHGKTKKQK